MTNVNDEAPVFYPDQPQTVDLLENVDPSVEFIHFVQAHDPDGDGITFKFVGQLWYSQAWLVFIYWGALPL